MENASTMRDLAGKTHREDHPVKRAYTSYPRRYQLQMEDEDGQKVTVQSSYLVKCSAIGEHLYRQWFWGKILDLEDHGRVVKIWPKGWASAGGE
jgi:hypothetical protein